MDLPDVSAALLRTTGDDFQRQLQARLIALADGTDDEAYASRLRLVASGKRPLRTLLADPQWRDSFGPQMQSFAEPPPALDEEQRRAFDDAVSRARAHVALPTDADVAADAADVMRRARLTEDAVTQDALNGWGQVYDVPEDPSTEPR